jgi:hypothetical protein
MLLKTLTHPILCWGLDVSETTVNTIVAFLERLVSVFSSVSGVGFWVFLVGFTLILLVVAALFIKLLITLVKLIPNMTVGQFLKLIVVMGIVLIVAGFFIP